MLSKSSGVTLIELMVTLIIVGVVAALAVPAYDFYVQNTRALTLTNDFTSSIAFARTEALKQGSPVTVCAASDTTNTACGNAGAWINGWIIFSDPNGDGAIANQTDRLRVHQALQPGTTFTTNQARITYSGVGFATVGAGTYTMSAPGCSGNNSRVVTITNTGRAGVAEAPC